MLGFKLQCEVGCAADRIGYITRPDNKGAKAGNINNAMKNIHGDLMAVLDADMIPSKDFLQKTVGYFCNPNLAFGRNAIKIRS